jgi:hypothetical protein
MNKLLKCMSKLLLNYVIPTTTVKYGLLYNWYAMTDLRGISNGEFLPPENSDYGTLAIRINSEVSLGNLPDVGVGSILKSQRTATGDPLVGIPTNEDPYWNYNETNYGRDSLGFNIPAAGDRGDDFYDLNTYTLLGCTNDDTSIYTTHRYLAYNTNQFNYSTNQGKYSGTSLRLVRSATVPEQSLTDGTSCGVYTGNDGKRYNTIKIGIQVWTNVNLAETKYANGESIPIVTDNSTWVSLITGALCAYNNNWNYV